MEIEVLKTRMGNIFLLDIHEIDKECIRLELEKGLVRSYLIKRSFNTFEIDSYGRKYKLATQKKAPYLL